MALTSISVDTEVREFLKDKGRKGETYNKILRRLLRIGDSEKVG